MFYHRTCKAEPQSLLHASPPRRRHANAQEQTKNVPGEGREVHSGDRRRSPPRRQDGEDVAAATRIQKYIKPTQNVKMSKKHKKNYLRADPERRFRFIFFFKYIKISG